MKAIVQKDHPGEVSLGIDLDHCVQGLQAQIDAATTRAEDARQRRIENDWSVGDVQTRERPPGVSRAEGKRLRSVAIQDERTAHAEIEALRLQLHPIQRQRDALAAEVARANAPTLADHDANLHKTLTRRETLSNELAEQRALIADIDRQAIGLTASQIALSEARAKSFIDKRLATTSVIQSRAQAVADAELAHDLAVAEAAEGTAAKPLVIASIKRLCDELQAIEQRHASVTAARDVLIRDHARAAAMQSLNALMEQAQRTLAQMRAADHDLAYKITRAWREEGLRSLDGRGWITTPGFLRPGA